MEELRKKVGDMSLQTRAIKKPKASKTRYHGTTNLVKNWLSYSPKKSTASSSASNNKEEEKRVTVCDEFIRCLTKKYPRLIGLINDYNDLSYYIYGSPSYCPELDSIWVSVCYSKFDHRGHLHTNVEKFIEGFLSKHADKRNSYYFKIWNYDDPGEWDKMGTFYERVILDSHKLDTTGKAPIRYGGIVVYRNEKAAEKMRRRLRNRIRTFEGVCSLPTSVIETMDRLLLLLQTKIPKAKMFYNYHNLIHADQHPVFKRIIVGWRRGFLPLNNKSRAFYSLSQETYDMRVVQVDFFGTLHEFVMQYVLRGRHQIHDQGDVANETNQLWRQYFLYDVPEKMTAHDLRSSLRFFAGCRKSDQDRILLRMYACLERMGSNTERPKESNYNEYNYRITKPPKQPPARPKKRQCRITEFFVKVQMEVVDDG